MTLVGRGKMVVSFSSDHHFVLCFPENADDAKVRPEGLKVGLGGRSDSSTSLVLGRLRLATTERLLDLASPGTYRPLVG